MATDRSPLEVLEGWLDDARREGAPHPWSATFVTSMPDGSPSARTVTLKRIEARALVFTSALWTRKVAELEANPQVALAFHWPSLGRQALITGTARVAERSLAEELFAERPRAHQLQAWASRQGTEIESLSSVRSRLRELDLEHDGPVPCPPDWGAILVVPTSVEFWEEAPDRLHGRLYYERAGGAWSVRRLAP